MAEIILRNIIIAFFDILFVFIFIRILLGFFPVNPYGNPGLYNIVNFFRQLTEPFLAPFRSLVPPIRLGGGFLDLSPILAIIVLNFIRRLLLTMI